MIWKCILFFKELLYSIPFSVFYILITRVQILKEPHLAEQKIHLLILDVSKNICLHLTQVRQVTLYGEVLLKFTL